MSIGTAASGPGFLRMTPNSGWSPNMVMVQWWVRFTGLSLELTYITRAFPRAFREL